MMDQKSSMLQILKLFTREQKQSHQSDFLKFLSTLSIPVISQDQINFFIKSYDETHDLLASLIIFHDVLTFDRENLQKVLSFDISHNKEILKAAPFIYMNSIGFILTSTGSTFNEDFLIVMNSIFSLSYYDYDNSIFIYLFLLDYFIENSNNMIDEDNVRLICSHFCLQTKPNIKIYNIMIEMLIKVKSCDNCLDQIFPTFAVILRTFLNQRIDIDIKLLSDTIIQNLLNVRYQVFELILVLSRLNESEHVKKIYSYLPKSIEFYMSEKPIGLFDNKQDDTNENDKELIEHKFDESLLSLQCEGNLESGFYPEIYDSSELSDSFYSPATSNFLNLFLNVLPIDIKKSYLDSFMESIEKVLTENYNINFLLAIVYILSKIKCKFILSQKVLDMLFEKKIFDPSITVFNSSIIDHKNVFLLRNLIVQITFQFCKYGSTTFFKKCESWPFMFVELLLRSVKFDMSKLFNDTFLNSFCKVYFELCDIDLKKAEEKIVSKRPILYFFLKFLLEIPSLPYNELSTFSEGTEQLIMAVISENSFKTTIDLQMKKYLYSNKYLDFNPVCHQIGNLITLINQASGNLHDWFHEYLQVFYDALQKNPCLKNAPSSVNLLNSFLSFIENHPNEEKLIKVLKILSLYNRDLIDNWIFHRLSIIIPKSLEKNLNDEMIVSLFNLLSVSFSSNSSLDNFLIENGKPLHLIFSVFSSFNRTAELLHIINVLCDYSACNRIRLHEYEFDLILLDILIHFPDDFIFKECKIVNIDESYFDLLFEVLAKITVTKSNQIVADRLLKVICHSKISEKFLKFFIPFDKLANKYAITKYPLGIQQLYFEADNITDDTVKQGFSIAFWIFVDNPISEKLKIRATVLKGMNFFNLDVCQNMLYLSDINNKSLITFPIRTQHWNAVVLNFHDDSVTIYVNKNFVSEKVKLTTFNSKNTFTFGNEIDNQSDIDEILSVYSLSSFSMFMKELSSIEIDQFISQTLELQPLFSFPMDPSNPPLQSPTMYIDMSGFLPKMETIIDTFSHTYPIENVIPLFSQFHKFDHRILILYSIEDIFQNRFNALSEIIAYLLLQNRNQEIFDYDLYLAFYSFMKKPDEKEVLFESLIVNCDLWIHSTFDDMVRIVTHWKEVLFPEFEFFFYRKSFFLRFLSEIRAMYFVLLNERKIDHDEINRVIQPCLDLIELIAKNGFDDYKSVRYFETLLKSDNKQLTSQMVNILPNLLTNLKAEQSLSRLVDLFLCLDFDSYKNMFHSVIQTLSIISTSKFYEATVILGYQIPPDFESKYFENELEQFPTLSFICLKTALKSSPQIQSDLCTLLLKVISKEENTKMFLTFDMWFIWPVLFALQTAEMEIISFFINSIIASDFSIDQVENIFSFVDLLGLQTTLNVKEFKCNLIKGLYELLTVDIKRQNQSELLELGFECLFANCAKENISDRLIELYKDSVFNIDDIRPSSLYKGQIHSMKDLKNVLEIDFLNYSYYLQFNKTSHFTKLVNSFYQVYLLIVQNASDNNSYVSKLISFCSQYPNSEPEKCKQFFECGSKLTQFVGSIYKRTNNFSIHLNEFFKKVEKPLQNIEKLKNKTVDPLIEVYKGKELRLNSIKKDWKKVLKQFVHPHAVFDADCFEWKRDFFMTPDFVSNKLKRCIKKLRKLNVFQYPFLKKLFDEDQMSLKVNKASSASENKNISSKISSSSSSSSSSLIASYSCLLIKINKRSPVIFNLHNSKFEIVGHEKTKLIKLSKVHDIFTRSRLQKKTALEFFLMNGKSYLIDFAPTSSLTVLKQINGLNLPSKRVFENDDYSSFIQKSNIIQKWQMRNITTFDLLMNLNIFSGRSFHDSENYIIFPWVLAFANSKTLRNFDRPMAAQTDARFNYYKKKLEQGEEMPEMSNFVFGSAPSNAMLLSYYFVRMEPFTSLHLKVHDGKFDVLNRIFRSVDGFFAGMSSSDDSRESAPEFYSMPEMFFDMEKIKVYNDQCEAKKEDEKEGATDDAAIAQSEETASQEETVKNEDVEQSYEQTRNNEEIRQSEEQTEKREEVSFVQERSIQSNEPDAQIREQAGKSNEDATQSQEETVKNEESTLGEEQSSQSDGTDAQRKETDAQEQALQSNETVSQDQGPSSISNPQYQEEQVTLNEEPPHQTGEQAAAPASQSEPDHSAASNVQSTEQGMQNEAASAQSVEQGLHDEIPRDEEQCPPRLSSSSSSEFYMERLNPSPSGDARYESCMQLIGDLEVPSWSGSIYDFVYELRTILESDEVSDHISQWIDLLFGLSQRGEEALKRCNLYLPYLYEDVWKGTKPGEEQMITTLLNSLGSMPPVIFKEKVISRTIPQSGLTQDKVFNFEYDHQINLGFPFMTGPGKCYVIAIDCAGCVSRIQFDILKKSFSLISKDNFLRPSDHLITLYHKTSVYVIDCKNYKVSFISPDTIITKKVPDLEKVEFVDAGIYERNFFTTSKTGAVYLWDSYKLNSPQLVLNVFSDSLKAATVSQNFGVFVFATNDGYCEIYSLNGKRFVNSIYLDGFVGQRILITPKLGLIIVKTLEKIWVMTINGFVIKKVPFGHQLGVCTLWSSNSGIDFIAVADLNGNVWSFEAYYPEKAAIVKSCHDPVVGMEYDSDSHCLLIVTMKPLLHIVSI